MASSQNRPTKARYSRRAGLTVQNHAELPERRRREEDKLVGAAREPLVTHHGFLISPSDDATIAALVEQLRELGRVEQTLWLGLIE